MRNITIKEMENRMTAKKLEELINSDVEIVAVAKYNFHNNNTNEDIPQCLFATADGELYRTGAKSFMNSLEKRTRTCEMCGMDTVKGKLVQKKTKSGYNIIVFD